jgi:hypothetical protein
VTIPPRVKPEENLKEREEHENNPCTLTAREKEKDAGLTIVRVRINSNVGNPLKTGAGAVS